MKKLILQGSLLSIAIISGCTNYKHIGEFAASAKKSIVATETAYEFYLPACQLKVKYNIAENCDIDEIAQARAQVLFDVVKAYHDALAAVAGKKLPTFKKADDLEDAIKNNWNVDEEGRQSGIALSKVIASLLADWKKDKAVKKAIIQADEPMTNVIKVIQTDLLESLFKQLIGTREKIGQRPDLYARKYSSEPLALIHAQREFDKELADLQTQIENIDKLKKTLGAMTVAHNNLKNNAYKLKSNEVIKSIVEYINETNDALAKLDSNKK